MSVLERCPSYEKYSYSKMTDHKNGMDQHQVSGLERCPSYEEYSDSKMTEKRQGPTPGVRLKEVSVKRESTVIFKIK